MGGADTEDDLALIDAVADANSDEQLRRLSADPRLAVRDEITSYTTYGGERKVTLRRRSAPPV
ncbi:hypothetical protein ACFYPC_33620 [Streptomyces sp. NPDC005808]|uniref:hypothetical protein n=1 Tax=Streptomyces sp. NPDC005808 TaxID=3364734 RepID=UPI0036BB997B